MIRFARLGLEAARQALAPMPGNPKWDYSGGLFGVGDILGGGVAFAVHDDGGPVAVVVLERVEYEGGCELLVSAAYSTSRPRALVERVLPEIERQFGKGFDAVTMYTRRAGLVAKLAEQGYSEAAVKMRKALK